ncbi:rhodanese-like domain-containing protein [Rhodobacter sp. 24-YEA-8]|uniref:rhodanese-like domain-containing protein n=1 Tax=Rhodobacter sp. 24-YEA-8 TaxID=1884310 RepID=UPI00089781A3|nr:rhodanese-like domain-containing protein [Rhodobacter sp. 24-YEA-8]SED86740.1 Rhodanese-related sulfurtransferase [Rhodobacter sp. 24-YEA-8]
MPSTITRHIKDMVAEANQQVKTLTTEAALALYGRDDVVFVDLRDPRELTREGKIPEAFSCPRGMLEFWIDPESPYAKPVFQEDKTFVFYCASGWRSALAAKTAQDMGLAPVAHILGGFGDWKRAGNPVEAVEPKAKP